VSKTPDTPVRQRRTWIGITVYAVITLAILVGPTPGLFEAVTADYAADLGEPLPRRALGHYRYMKRHLEQPFSGYGRWQVLVPQFSVILLSHAACGLTNVALADPARKDEVAALLDEVVRRALSAAVSPYGRSPEDVNDLGDHNLYLSHLNLILGCRRHIVGDTRYDRIHGRISRHLAAQSLADGDYHARSYPDSPKFPADQAVTLASLYVYDMCHGTARSRELIPGWLRYMSAEAAHPETGLHRSSITPSFPDSRIPRGCALSWTCLYLAQFAPEHAAELYLRYRALYFRGTMGFGGFREWPPGYDGRSDVDSGPIVFGIGLAASGIGVGPARLFGDRRAYAAILRTGATFGMPRPLGAERKYWLSPLLGEAILLHGMTARRWYGPLPQVEFRDAASFPTGPLLVLIVLMVIVGLSLWRVKRLVRRLRPRHVNSEVHIS